MSSRWFALLLRLYPAPLRRQYREDLIAAMGHCWRAECAAHRWLGPMRAIARAVMDAMRARIDSPGESRWMQQHRDGVASRRRRAIGDWWSDVQYAIRAIRFAPGFFAAVLLTLVIGIGANAAVFSLVKAVILQPLPYAAPDELVMLWRSRLVAGPLQRGQATPRFVLGWREHARDIATIAAVNSDLAGAMDVGTEHGAERLSGGLATSNFFQVIGTRPLLGRVFTPADEDAGATDLVVLSYAAWTRQFGGNRGVVGQRVTLTAGLNRRRAPRPYTVIGVLEPGFHFKYPEHVQIWAMRTWAEIAAEPLDAISYQVVGRLQPAVSSAAAADRFSKLYELIRPYRPTTPIGDRYTTRLERVHDWVVGDTDRPMALLTGVAVLLLVITCATVANALLIRVAHRQRELALRTALGASRRRILGQLLTEGLVLTGLGTVGGVALAVAMTPAVPRRDEIGVDASVLWFAIGATALVTIFATLAPAWQGSRLALAPHLRRKSAAVTGDRSTRLWRRALVTLQAAVAAALVVSSALLLVSLRQLTTVPLGFDAADTITVELRLLGAESAEEIRRLQQRLVERIGTVAGVQRVGITSAVPFRGTDWRRGFTDRDVTANERQVDVNYLNRS